MIVLGGCKTSANISPHTRYGIFLGSICMMALTAVGKGRLATVTPQGVT